MLSAEGISYGTRDREILYEISLRSEAGEFVGIIGPNGSGKSTLLKLSLIHISPPSSASSAHL